MVSLLKKTLFRGPLTLSVIIVLLGAALFISSSIPFLSIIELKTIDMRFIIRGKKAVGDTVVLVAVDEKSLKAEGRWAWPRSKIADLVNRLSDKGARVIAFDIGFFEPESTLIINTIEEIKKTAKTNARDSHQFVSYLETLQYQQDNDRILAEAIKNSKADVILGFFFQINPEDAAHISEDEIRLHGENIYGAEFTMTQLTSEQAKFATMTEAIAPQSNIRAITESTPLAGFFNKLTDPDGVVRKIPMVIRFNETLYAPLALKAISAYLDAPLSIRIGDMGVESVRVGELSIPVDDRGEAIINYRGEEHTFPHISATDVLNDRIPEEALRDKIVLVGATAIGIHDECVTPLAKVFPGPEVHLNIMDSILAEDFIFHPVWVSMFDLLIIILGGLFLALVLSKTGAFSGGVAAVSMFGGYIWLCQYFFSHMGWILNMVYPLCVFLSIYLAVTSYKYFSEEGQKKFIREAFSKYLAPEVVDQLIASPQKLVLGGERREITAFFSDVQGFTGISEKLAPEELVELLNEFLTEVTDIIMKYKGGVDKYEGDAVIAFFGAPNELKNHPEAACLACIDIQARMVELRESWKQRGKPELKVRIGLYSGPAVVGNMGSRNRMDYTMMGDTVNTAARLEGVNKRYGTYLMIGDATYQAASESIAVRELDAVKVVGKNKPLIIYEVLGRKDAVPKPLTDTVELYAKGLAEYRQRNWARAVAFFQMALEITPEDGPSTALMNRCRQNMENPPAEDWDGSFAMDTK
jgi:adenylate cyclase